MNQELATEAYMFGFPIVTNFEHIEYATHGFDGNPAAGYNTIMGAKTLANPEYHFESINNDTVYLASELDLSVGPVLFEIPEIKDRYYVFQFIDAWTDNYAYLGERSLGSKGGKFAITPPNYDGEIPAGYTEIKSPTRFSEIVGRIAVSDEDDLANVVKIEEQLSMKQMYPDKVPSGIPEVQKTADNDSLHFWEQFRVYLELDPTAPRYEEMLKEYDQFGIRGDDDTYTGNVDPKLKEVLKQALVEGPKRLRYDLKNNQFKMQNGWQLSFHQFDYNFDYFELGTIDTDEWMFPHANLQELKHAVEMRFMTSANVLWGNNGYEAIYLPNFTDQNGDQLNGENEYSITFKQTPPNNAFWSITMYNTEDFNLVVNPINRYSIGDRSKGLVKNDDGSTTIIMSNKKPEKMESNWLPAPAGDFRPILRVYLPKEDSVNGTYVFPAIIKNEVNYE